MALSVKAPGAAQVCVGSWTVTENGGQRCPRPPELPTLVHVNLSRMTVTAEGDMIGSLGATSSACQATPPMTRRNSSERNEPCHRRRVIVTC